MYMNIWRILDIPAEPIRRGAPAWVYGIIIGVCVLLLVGIVVAILFTTRKK